MDGGGPLPQGEGDIETEVEIPRPVVVFDLDWTLLNGVAIQHLARRCGVYQEAKAVWTGYGGPDSLDAEGLKQLTRLFEGQPFEALEIACRQMFLRPASGEVVNAFKQMGFAVGVVADSFQVSADLAARRLGLQVAAGARLGVEDGVVTGELLPSPSGACDRWLCREAALARMASLYRSPVTVAVGDSQADVCMLEAADLGIAVDRASEAARRVADHQAPLIELPDVVSGYLEEQGIEVEADPLVRP